MTFHGPACTDGYSRHTGLLLMVLQRKGLQGRIDNMIVCYILVYYMAGSASRQDEADHVF